MTEKSGKSRLCYAYMNELALSAAFSKMANMGMTEAEIQGGLITLVLVKNEAEETSREKADAEPVKLDGTHVALLWRAIGMGNHNYRRRLDWWLNGDNHRNMYSLWIGNGKINPYIEYLVSSGLMKSGRVINGGQDQYFHVTEAGIKLAREEFFRERAKAKT